MKKIDLLKVPLNRKKIVFLICVALTKKEFRKDPLGCYELMVHILSDIFLGFQICGFFHTFFFIYVCEIPHSGSGNPCRHTGFSEYIQDSPPLERSSPPDGIPICPPQIRRFSVFHPPPQSEKVKS